MFFSEQNATQTVYIYIYIKSVKTFCVVNKYRTLFELIYFIIQRFNSADCMHGGAVEI